MGRRVKKAFTITVVIIIEIDRDRRGDWERGWNVAKGIVGGSVRCRRSARRLHAVHDRAGVGSEAISSGCICMTNEDVMDLYKRVTPGTVVVVLGPHQGDPPFSPRVAASGNPFQ